MAKKVINQYPEDVVKQLEGIREWEGFTVNENKGTIHVGNAPITKLQLGAKNWIMVRSKTYWFQVDPNHLWLVKDCYRKGHNIDLWATPISKNHGKMYQIQTSGN